MFLFRIRQGRIDEEKDGIGAFQLKIAIRVSDQEFTNLFCHFFY
jgi:hypothetical protein